MTTANVRSFGARGDGSAADDAAIQKALDSGAARVEIPAGAYRITRTLFVRSNTAIAAEPGARVFVCGETPHRRGDFLLTNAGHAEGDANITIRGGVWDGHNAGRLNVKPPDLFDPGAWSGATLNFYNIRGLALEDMILDNAVTFNARFGKIDGFLIRNIGFRSAELRPNQDGLHFAGFVRNGVVENVAALTSGQTNDDLIALNADDSVVRLENRDLDRGPIENLAIRNVRAENCYSAFRVLSVDAPIRGIRISGVTAGCRHYAINMDAARHCATPLFADAERPAGVGAVEDFAVDGMTVWHTEPSDLPLLRCETNAKTFAVRNFRRDLDKDRAPGAPTLTAHCLSNAVLRLKGGGAPAETRLKSPADTFSCSSPFTDLAIN